MNLKSQKTSLAKISTKRGKEHDKDKRGDNGDVTIRTTNTGNSNRDPDSEAINLKLNECISDGNLNIKENMKAGTGIVFSEGKSYVD